MSSSISISMGRSSAGAVRDDNAELSACSEKT